MAQSQPSFINLTWRSKNVTHRDLLSELELLLNQYDKDGEVRLAYNASKENRVAHMQEAVGRAPAMYRTSGKLMNRSLPKSEGTTETSSNKIAGRNAYLISEMLQRVTSRVSFLKRRYFYETGLQDQGLSEDDVYNMLINMALTLKVHPYRLGLKAEENSQVYVPERCTLKLDVVNDIFKYVDEDQDAIKPRHMQGGQAHNVPAMINNLSIETDGVALRAVVVTEHRNIKDVLFNMQGNEGWNDLRGVMVVMTAGFPDWAVREFLNLLSKSSECLDLPFIWLSDGDSHGIAKYLQCKYGSRPTAFAAPSMVCPRLLFGGMKQSVLDDFVAKYPERTLGARLKLNPLLSEEEKTTISTNATSEAAAKKQHLMSLRLHGRKRTAHINRLKGIRNAGYLGNNREPEVEAAVKGLEQNGPCFALSCVSTFDAHGMLFVMRDAVLAARNEQPAEIPFVVQQDSLRADFVAAGGQAHGQDSYPDMDSQRRVVVEEEEEFDEDEVIEESALI